MWFRVIGKLCRIEVIARSGAIRELARLRKVHGGRRWRKLKGIAGVELPNGRIRVAEIHWYEAHGVGRREMKIKRFLD
jgi:hypothetical protein